LATSSLLISGGGIVNHRYCSEVTFFFFLLFFVFFPGVVVSFLVCCADTEVGADAGRVVLIEELTADTDGADRVVLRDEIALSCRAAPGTVGVVCCGCVMSDVAVDGSTG
jgi:hypothetical protein